MPGINDDIQIRKFCDYSSNSQEFFIRCISDIKLRAGKNLTIPKKLEFYKMVFITRGSGQHMVDFQPVELKIGKLLLIRPGTVQCFSDAEDLEGIAIHFTREFFIKERENFKYLFNLNLLSGSSVIECSDGMLFLLNQIKEIYFNLHTDEYYEQIINYLRVLLFEIKMMKQPKECMSVIASQKLFGDFEKAIEKNINYKTKVRDICIGIKVDAKQLNVLLQSNTGKSAKELLDERLILEIKRLLIYTNLSAKEIAFRLKFDEPANMSNYFKRHTGLTPLQFRSQK